MATAGYAGGDDEPELSVPTIDSFVAYAGWLQLGLLFLTYLPPLRNDLMSCVHLTRSICIPLEVT